MSADTHHESARFRAERNQTSSSLPSTAPKGPPRKLERHRPASQTEPDPELLSEAVDPSLPPQPPGIEVLSSYPLETSGPPAPAPAEVPGQSLPHSSTFYTFFLRGIEMQSSTTCNMEPLVEVKTR